MFNLNKHFLLFLTLVLFSSTSYCQFSIVSTFPVNGATNIDTATTMSITFNSAIDTSVRFNFPGDFFMSLFFSPDTLLREPDSISLSPDGLTVYLHNLHLSTSIVYRFCMLDAVNMSGDSLDIPYSITFSTGPTMPNSATVSGTVSYPGNDPTGAIVLLFDSNPFEENESEFMSWAVVSNSSGNYTSDFVEENYHWPMVIKNFYFDEEGEIQIQDGSKLGFWDANGDNRPDSIFVSSGSNITGINFTLQEVYYQTARDPLNELEIFAQNWSSDAQLVQIGGEQLIPDGRSIFWQYVYYSPSLAQFREWFTAGELIAFVKDDSVNADTTALPLNWINSDSIMANAEEAGGMQFRMDNPETRSSGGCGYFIPQFKKQKFLPKVQISSIKKSVWNIEYYSETTWEYFNLLLDAVTAEVLNKPVTAAAAEQSALSIAQDWSADAMLWRLENQGSPVDPGGKTDYWDCIYYSASKDSLYAVELWGLLPYWAGNPFGITTNSNIVYSGWMDSEEALGITEIQGGSDYRLNNQEVYVQVILGQWYGGTVPDSIVWQITYYSLNANPLEFILDPYSLNNIDKPGEFYAPDKFILYQNYPNPFNPVTTISFRLPQTSDVTLNIYNLIGQQMEMVKLNKMPAGENNYNWNAEHLSSGVYFYKITAGEYTSIKKCVLIK